MHGWRSVFVLMAIGASARLAAIAYLDSPSWHPAVAYEHAAIAKNIVLGRGFSFHFYGQPGEVYPTSQQAPWVSCVLAGAYGLFGVESRAAFVAVLIVQSLAGGVVIYAITRLTRRVTGDDRWAFWSGLASAVYPPLVVACAYVQPVSWNLLALALGCWGVVEIAHHPRRGAGLLAISGTLGWLNDPIIGATVTLLAIHRFWAEPAQRRSIACSLAFILVILMPWTIRNSVVHGRCIPVKDSFWYVFWQGNTAKSHGTDKLRLPGNLDARGSWTAEIQRQRSLSVDTTLPTECLADLRACPTEIERMDLFGQWIREELTAYPMQYVDKCSLRLRQWLWMDETNPRGRVLIYRLSYVALLLLAGWGISLTRGRGGDWSAVLLALALLTAVHVGIITSARFRLPAEMLLVPWAGIGWAQGILPAASALLARVRIAHRELFPSPARDFSPDC